jgi:hypothetical protein
MRPDNTMKLFLAFLLVGIQAAIAIQSQKPVIVMYPEDTPDSILGQAKQMIIEAVCGCEVLYQVQRVFTYYFSLFRAVSSHMSIVS